MPRSPVEVAGRLFEVETAGRLGGARVSVWNQGSLVAVRDFPVPDGEAGANSAALEALHQERLEEIRTLFLVRDKVFAAPQADSLYKLGVVLLARGFLKDARESLALALREKPDHLEAQKHLGVCHTLLGEPETAVGILAPLLEAHPRFADIAFHLGNAYQVRRSFQDALQCYRYALQVNPRYGDAHLQAAAATVGMLVDEGGHFTAQTAQSYTEQALKSAEAAAEILPALRNKAFLLALDHLRRGKWTQSYTQFQECRPRFLPKVGSDSVFLFTLSLLYGPQGVTPALTERYVRDLQRLVAEHPEYPDLRNQLAVAQLVQSQFLVRSSLQEVQAALKINEAYTPARESCRVLEDVYKSILLVIKQNYR